MTAAHDLTDDVVLCAIQGHVSAEVDGELVMMSVEKGRYYGLDEVGRRVWELLQKPTPVGAMLDALVAEYEVDREVCARDVLPLLGLLVEHELVRTVDAAAE